MQAEKGREREKRSENREGGGRKGAQDRFLSEGFNVLFRYLSFVQTKEKLKGERTSTAGHLRKTKNIINNKFYLLKLDATRICTDLSTDSPFVAFLSEFS